MRISDDERREIANGLRRLADGRRDTGVPDSEILDVLEISPADAPNCADARDVEILADLIDCPTCEMKGHPGERYGVCTRCGAFVRRDAVTNCTSVIPVKFCPNCRAKVI